MGKNPMPAVTSRMGLKLYTAAENEALCSLTESSGSSAPFPLLSNSVLSDQNSPLGPYCLHYVRAYV